MTFAQLLTEIREEFGTQTALAHAIGLSPSRVARAEQGGWTFDALHCLRLAQVSGRPPSLVLRAAGKGELADLIETLYETNGRRIDWPSRAASAAYARMSKGSRALVVDLMRQLAE